MCVGQRAFVWGGRRLQYGSRVQLSLDMAFKVAQCPLAPKRACRACSNSVPAVCPAPAAPTCAGARPPSRRPSQQQPGTQKQLLRPVGRTKAAVGKHACTQRRTLLGGCLVGAALSARVYTIHCHCWWQDQKQQHPALLLLTCLCVTSASLLCRYTLSHAAAAASLKASS